MESRPLLDRVHVLVVAADPNMRDAVEIILQEAGASVTRAASWASAVDWLSRVAVDVVLVFDWGLEMDAAAIAQALRALPVDRGGDTALVLLTYDGVPMSRAERIWAVQPTALDAMLETLRLAAGGAG